MGTLGQVPGQRAQAVGNKGPAWSVRGGKAGTQRSVSDRRGRSLSGRRSGEVSLRSSWTGLPDEVLAAPNEALSPGPGRVRRLLSWAAMAAHGGQS